MRFMDSLAAPGAIADPEVLRALEQSSFEMYFERVGPWVGVVTKAIDLYYKNKEWGEGVERRNAMRAELTRIATRIGELEYDLGYAAEARDSYRGFLSRCRQEMGWRRANPMLAWYGRAVVEALPGLLDLDPAREARAEDLTLRDAAGNWWRPQRTGHGCATTGSSGHPALRPMLSKGWPRSPLGRRRCSPASRRSVRRLCHRKCPRPTD